MNEIVNQFVDVTAIRPHPRNYKIHPEQQIQQLGMSHARLNQFRSIVLWQQTDGTYITLAGHGILEAMKRNGVTQVRADIHPPSLSREDADAILLADNLHAQNSSDEETLLAELLQEQVNAGYDLESLGSDDEALRDMLAKMTPPTLDELAEQYGDEPADDAFWPVIRVKVSPETKELYDSLMEEAQGTDESVKFAWLLERVNVADEGNVDSEK